MDARFNRLLTAFGQVAKGPPPDLTVFVASQPEAGSLPSPWETWTLIGLARHRERQLWVETIIRTKLRGDPSDLAAIGALGHPEGVKQRGPVPGMPEWEYYFHGRGCCITHKVNGDAIDVDFWDDSAEYFDTYFYTRFLESLRQPEPPEQRLRELHRSLKPVGIVVKDLTAAGALTPLPGRDEHPPKVSDAVVECGNAINAFCTAWVEPGNRLWLAALIGDWLAADDEAEREELTKITRPRAERCRQLRRERLLKEEGFPAADALYGLSELGGIDEQIEAALRSPPSGLISAALAIVGEQNDPRWCPQVYALFSRVTPSGQAPQPHIWITSLKFLIRHGYRPAEMFAALTQAGGTAVGEAVLLSLEHAPEHAIPLIRKALLHDIPMNRMEVAAILAVFDKPWSRMELMRALVESDDQETTADARAALLELSDPECEKAVLAWEEKNPHEQEMGSYLEINGRRLGPFYSMSEHSLKNRGAWIKFEMEKFHDRVMKVRDVVPPEPPGSKPWWKFW